MRNSLCILHWMPVEDFPPAVNMARHFAERGNWDVSVCTNRNRFGHPDFSHDAVELVRGIFPAGKSGIRRLLAYCSFHLKSFVHLLRKRPDVILYIEPHSALPVFLSRLIHRRPRIFIHYHEYHSPDEYEKPGMRMAKWCHRLERAWLYPIAEWISQTNEGRLKLFLADNPEIDELKGQLLPNHPPRSWWGGENRAWSEEQASKRVVRFVYVGSLSRADTFIEEAVRWMKNLEPGTATLDIYSYILHEETRSYLRRETDECIRFHENGVSYDDLPSFLKDFHVGLILYKGNTPNYIHNATNKLFEYLACGLDVIYPRQMTGVKPYAFPDSRPRVIECDFEDLSTFSYLVQGRQQLPQVAEEFTCESELGRLEQAMLSSMSSSAN